MYNRLEGISESSVWMNYSSRFFVFLLFAHVSVAPCSAHEPSAKDAACTCARINFNKRKKIHLLVEFTKRTTMHSASHTTQHAIRTTRCDKQCTNAFLFNILSEKSVGWHIGGNICVMFKMYYHFYDLWPHFRPIK